VLTLTELSPRAMEVVCEGRVTLADTAPVFETMDRFIEHAGGKVDVLADVRGAISFNPAILIEELKHLGTMIRMVRALERVALVADADWVRAIGKLESLVIPGIDYRIYKRDGAAEARAFVLRQDD
jgi:hypothetical protein